MGNAHVGVSACLVLGVSSSEGWEMGSEEGRKESERDEE